MNLIGKLKDACKLVVLGGALAGVSCSSFSDGYDNRKSRFTTSDNRKSRFYTTSGKNHVKSEEDRSRERSNDGALLGLGLIGLGIGRGVPGVAAVGRGMVDLSAAERSRSNITINNSISNEERESRIRAHQRLQLAQRREVPKQKRSIDKRFSTAFNYWVDEDGDGLVNADELKGRSDTFYLSREKEIRFGTVVKNHEGDYLHFYLYNGSLDKPIAYGVGILITGNSQLASHKFNAEYLKEIGAIGKCVVDWRVGKEKTWTGVEPVIDKYTVNFLE
jgi:hypothetical protein